MVSSKRSRSQLRSQITLHLTKLEIMFQLFLSFLYFFSSGQCEVEFDEEAKAYIVPYRDVISDFICPMEEEGVSGVHLTLRSPHHICMVDEIEGLDFLEQGTVVPDNST